MDQQIMLGQSGKHLRHTAYLYKGGNVAYSNWKNREKIQKVKSLESQLKELEKQISEQHTDYYQNKWNGD